MGMFTFDGAPVTGTTSPPMYGVRIVAENCWPSENGKSGFGTQLAIAMATMEPLNTALALLFTPKSAANATVVALA